MEVTPIIKGPGRVDLCFLIKTNFLCLNLKSKSLSQVPNINKVKDKHQQDQENAKCVFNVFNDCLSKKFILDFQTLQRSTSKGFKYHLTSKESLQSLNIVQNYSSIEK